MDDHDSQLSDLSFEEALQKLENIVKKLENGKLNLEEAIKEYELGNRLKLYCEKKLQESVLRVEKIIKTDQGEIIAEDY